jgi:hypothetical protein
MMSLIDTDIRAPLDLIPATKSISGIIIIIIII